ncbi:hypothetical protein PsorP6_002638 [Peronosclerospora sorghi]|uniref:Uncharacterized protein n=1 Tax=Peronosclerospora sorghi TaxID=230839 RepID=A0ACC0WT22_9STRA|nr:hypothetical protein PsorP6_002638 [Peronosclerospora sorghi]
MKLSVIYKQEDMEQPNLEEALGMSILMHDELNFERAKTKVEAKICTKNKQSLKKNAASSASGSGTEDNVKSIS